MTTEQAAEIINLLQCLRAIGYVVCFVLGSIAASTFINATKKNG